MYEMYDFDFNTDQELRDSKLITPEWVKNQGYHDENWYHGGLRHFNDMDYDTLQWMVDNRFADLEERQNDGPTIKSFLRYLKDRPNFSVIGYVVDSSRNDYRLSVDGITATDLSVDDKEFFSTIFGRWADEYELNDESARAWWD